MGKEDQKKTAPIRISRLTEKIEGSNITYQEVSEHGRGPLQKMTVPLKAEFINIKRAPIPLPSKKKRSAGLES